MDIIARTSQVPSLSVQRSGGRVLPRHSYERACIATCLHASSNRFRSPENAAKALWPSDNTTPALLMRAAVDPITSDDAAVLVEQTVGDFYSSLSPISAGAKLINAGIRVPLEGRGGAVIIPKRQGLPTASLGWVDEGDAVATRQFSLASDTLGPGKKLANVVLMTRELTQRSAAPDLITALIREDAALSVDAGLFSDAAPSEARPAGLLAGLTPIAATAGGGDVARLTDLENLAGAVADGGGSGNVAFITNPRQAAAIRIRQPDFAFDVWPSIAVEAGVVIAIDPGAFVSGFGTETRIESTTEALIHQEDVAPAAISTVGDPPVVSAPTRSLWQTDCIALRTVVETAWTMRTPAVAYVTGATW